MRNAILILVMFATSCSQMQSLGDDQVYESKSRMLLQHTANQYRPPQLTISDPEKYVWPIVISRFALYGTNDSISNYYLETLKDRSPFHFTMVGMARIMSLYGESTFIKTNKKDLLVKAFERSDSQNVLTSEGTENHINMTRTSGYLFYQHALEFPEEFPDAAEKMALIKEWMKWWSKQVYSMGTGEWNSSTYLAYSVIGWLNIYDFAHDPEVRDIARAVLDSYALELALHNSWGVTGGSEMRGSGVMLDGRSATEFLSWLWFANDTLPINGFAGSQYIQIVHAATSGYRPPSLIADLATSKPRKPVMYYGSKPSYNLEKPAFIHQSYYIHPNYTLGNATSNYGGFTGASYQMIPWKLVIKNSLPIVISGNGSFYKDKIGKTRNPYTQTVHYNNMVLQVTRVPSDAEETARTVEQTIASWGEKTKRDLIKRFPDEEYKLSINMVNTPADKNFSNQSYITLPSSSKMERFENGYFFFYEDITLAVTSLNPQNDTIYTSGNRTILESSAKPDELCGFAVEVLEDKKQYLSISLRHIPGENSLTYINSGGDTLTMKFTIEGEYVEPLVDWGFGPVEPQLRLISPPFLQPHWGWCATCGRVPELLVNGETIITRGVYSGQDVLWDKGILKVSYNQQSYTVDYSSDKPVFNKK
jgi:hypothetical protein